MIVSNIELAILGTASIRNPEITIVMARLKTSL